MKDALKFPPVAVFTIIFLLGVAVNIAAMFEQSQDSMQKLYLLNPIAVLTNSEIVKPARVSVMVMTNSTYDYSGWVAVVYIYAPNGELFDIRSGTIDSTGSATIEVWLGTLAPTGNYTLLPGIGFSHNYLIFGEPVFLKVKGGG